MESKNRRLLKLFGTNVRRQRTSVGLTQGEAAKRAKLDPTYISGIERGVRNPSLRSISRVARALGISVSALCEGVRE